MLHEILFLNRMPNRKRDSQWPWLTMAGSSGEAKYARMPNRKNERSRRLSAEHCCGLAENAAVKLVYRCAEILPERKTRSWTPGTVFILLVPTDMGCVIERNIFITGSTGKGLPFDLQILQRLALSSASMPNAMNNQNREAHRTYLTV
jgi:hypothetical protein